MAHHKAALKSIRQDAKRTERNRSHRSRVRTFVKKVEQAIEEGNKENAQKALVSAQSELFAAVTKGVLKQATASRKVSRLNKRVKELGAAPAKAAAAPKKKATAKKTETKKPAAKKAAAKKAE